MNYSSPKSPKFIKNSVSYIKDSSPIEKTLIAAILFFFLIAFLLTTERISNLFSVRLPINGGVVEEGVVGFPQNVNPITAKTNADYDLVALIYSGLMKVSGDGTFVPDLAESYTVSDEKKTYTFILRKNLNFHDGTPITAKDVVFTIEQIQNPIFESPLAGVFSEITVEAKDDSTVVFTLKNPYAGFLAETTVGIIPKHVWENVIPGSLEFLQFSSYPIGSGPFKVNKIKRDSTLGIPTHYSLVAFDSYSPRRPYIDRIEISFFAHESELIDALSRREIHSASSVSPLNLNKLTGRKEKLIESRMLRIFGLFFNQDAESVLSDREVREAINEALDRSLLAESIFSGYAEPTRTPLPFQSGIQPTSDTIDPREILEKDGWKLNEKTGIREKKGKTLSFTIKTGASNDLKETAEFIKHTLKSLGFDVTVETFNVNTLNQTVIRQRDYEALLFGQAYGRFIDLYPFWHSSGRNDPGLNVSKYTSSIVDETVVALRNETDENKRKELFEKVFDEFDEMVPAAFLYVPDFLYITDNKIHNIKIPPVERSSDRFSNVEDWYMYTDKIWKIFVKPSKT